MGVVLVETANWARPIAVCAFSLYFNSAIGQTAGHILMRNIVKKRASARIAMLRGLEQRKKSMYETYRFITQCKGDLCITLFIINLVVINTKLNKHNKTNTIKYVYQQKHNGQPILKISFLICLTEHLVIQI